MRYKKVKLKYLVKYEFYFFLAKVVIPFKLPFRGGGGVVIIMN